MAIRMMTSDPNQPNVVTINDYPGSETWRISHHWNCPHRHDPIFSKEKGPNCPDYCNYYQPIYLQTTYQNCVLNTYERNGYDDSDFYAIVWDEPSQSIKHIEYATTRGWSYPNSAQVDATEEVINKANEFLRQQQFKKWQEDNVKQATMPYKNRQVKVIKGTKKIPVNTIGTIFWFGEDQYKKARRNHYNQYNPYADLVGKFIIERYRVGLAFKDANNNDCKEFCPAPNVQVINPNQYLLPSSNFNFIPNHFGWDKVLG